jgi:small subunit ribosomal protein S5
LKTKIDGNALDLKDKVVAIKRVTKVIKGGRTMSFSALVVVGDGNGHVGFGLGKAQETTEAIRNGREDAKKNMIYIERNENDSVFHQTMGRFGSAKVVIKPAPAGNGIKAGASVRAVMELAGIKNVTAQCIGSRNKHNVVHASVEGLKGLKTPEQIARLRGKTVEELLAQEV